MTKAVKAYVLIVALLLVTIIAVASAKAATTPSQYLAGKEKTYVKSLVAGSGAVIGKVTCAPYQFRHTYLCNISGTNVKKKAVCISTYVHYSGRRFNPTTENFPQTWACGARPPVAPPPFPGDPQSAIPLPNKAPAAW